MSSEVGVERPTSLALDGTRPERRVHFSDAPISASINTSQQIHSAAQQTAKRFKSDPEFRPKRKRAWSCSIIGNDRSNNKKRKCFVVPPTKFLLGGNSGDPLNLAALDGKEEFIDSTGKNKDVASLLGGNSGSNNKRSCAVRVIIPPNINDPLNLDATSDNEISLTDAILKQRKRKRTRKRRRRNSEPGGIPSSDILDATSLSLQGKSSSEPNCHDPSLDNDKEKLALLTTTGTTTATSVPLLRSISAPSSTDPVKTLSVITDIPPTTSSSSEDKA